MTSYQLLRLHVKTLYNDDKKNKVTNFNYLNTLAKKGQIVFCGDSIIELWPLNELFTTLKEKTGLEVINRGISGDTTNRLVERIEENVCVIEPKAVYLLIGTNDHGNKFPLSYTMENIEKTIEIIKKNCPDCKIFIQSLLPVKKELNKDMVNQRKNRTLIKMNKSLQEICEDNDCIYVDVYEAVLDAIDELNPKYSFDGLHPNARGFKVITDIAQQVLIDNICKE